MGLGIVQPSNIVLFPLFSPFSGQLAQSISAKESDSQVLKGQSNEMQSVSTGHDTLFDAEQ